MTDPAAVTALIVKLWGEQGWQIRPTDRTLEQARAEGIARMTEQPRWNDKGELSFPGGRYFDFDKRAMAVADLVAAFHARQVTAGELAEGIYRNLPFLTADVRAELARQLTGNRAMRATAA